MWEDVIANTSAGRGTRLKKRRLWSREDTNTWLLYSVSPKFETVLRNNLLKMIFLGFHTRPAQAESWGGLGKRHAHVSLQNRSWTVKEEMRKAKERESEKVVKRQMLSPNLTHSDSESGWGETALDLLRLTPTEGRSHPTPPRAS